MPLDRPKHGAHVQELHDRLVVDFPPRPCWPAVAFALLWLTLWTIGGIDVVKAVATGEDSTWHLLELGPFAVGELFLARWTARQIWEHQFLVATLDRLEVRRDLGRFSRSRSCPVGILRAIRPVETSNDADESGERYRLEIVHRHGRIRVGNHLTETEAEHLASVTRSWLKRHAGWVEPTDAATSDWQRHMRSVLFPALVVVLLAGLAAGTLLDRGPPPSTQPTVQSVREGPERDLDGAATTRQMLATMRVLQHGQPSCHVASATRWSCVVAARATTGPDAGGWLTYRCSQSGPHGIHCGRVLSREAQRGFLLTRP